ncbi:PQQ-dependent sugar dehydrogenase [Pedobacter deserti]|uniref:PQQ-dependent sugar dehydrogenase n=1 Tax=Pedobacter deserti TaxID=2817382 RepID=UPI00210D9779|nr:sorbosone dehydrogenase family protein [Pedobacter sp. SYSU D00382]
MNKIMVFSAATLLMVACNSEKGKEQQGDSAASDTAGTLTSNLSLPKPDTTASKTKFSKVIGWPSDKTPAAPAGFRVSAFATGLKSPRNIYVASNGDVFVALSNSERSVKEKVANAISGKAKAEVAGESANTVVLLRDTNRDGIPELKTNFITSLNQPYGMLIIDNFFYVANTDGLYRYPYKQGDTQINTKGTKVLGLPAGGYNNHWTRNIVANSNNSKIYISVGSGSNVGENGMEHEKRRAAILEVNPDGTGEVIYAGGLRNPVGMDWAPGTSTLWTAVNERDGLGDDLVPDYITSVKRGGFYGWPYAYFGKHEDPRWKGRHPEMVAKSLVPDLAVGSHTASLGLHFYRGNKFPSRYRDGAFIGQHGSWNRSELSGYKVTFVPFKNGRPLGPMEDFLTGFIADAQEGDVYGRPVGIAMMKDGSLLVADDVSSTIWRVASR